MKHSLRLAIVPVGAITLAGICLSAARSEETTSRWKVPASESARKNPVPADQKSIATGKTVYSKNCVMCHGPTGKGDGPKGRDLEPRPRDLSSPQIMSESDGALFWKTTTGRRPMPSFSKLLSDEQRWHVVNYLRTLGAAPSVRR